MSDASGQLVVTCGCEKQVKMRVPASGMGKVFKCVQCGQRVHVTEQNTELLAPKSREADTGPASSPAEPIGALLVEHGLVTSEQLGEALAQQQAQGGKTFELLIALGYLDKDKLHTLLSRQPGIATIDLERMKVDKDLVDLVPEEMATACLVLPIDRLGRLLSVAMACPLDVATISRLEAHSGLKVKAMLAKYDVIREAVEKLYAPQEEKEDENLFRMPAGLSGTSSGAGIRARLEELEAIPADAQILKQLKEIAAGGSGRAKDFVRALGQDPGMVANAIRLANSRAYGMARQADSIALAVALTGCDAIVHICGHAPVAIESEGRTDLVKRAERASLVAAVLARKTNRVERGMAYTAGLLFELGRWGCLALDPNRFARLDLAKDGIARLNDESSVLGERGPDIAGDLAASWRFPPLLADALKHWPNPENAGRESQALAAILQLAALAGVARLNPAETCEASMGILGLKADVAVETIQKALQQ